ncbi:MAG TPA: four-carbon acid sugar kinase family protein, partial [Anaerolineae bacterium]
MIYIIADDLTGACDTGACFAQHGLSTAVQIGLPAEGRPHGTANGVLVY